MGRPRLKRCAFLVGIAILCAPQVFLAQSLPQECRYALKAFGQLNPRAVESWAVPETRKPIRLGISIGAPTLLAMGPHGFFVYDEATRSILSFSAEGDLRWRSSTGGDGNPFGNVVTLQLVDSGKLWLLDQSSRALSVFSLDGSRRSLVRFEEPVVGVAPVGRNRYLAYGYKTLIGEYDNQGRLLRPVHEDSAVRVMNILRKEAFVVSGGDRFLFLIFMYTGGGYVLDRASGKVTRLERLADFPILVSVRRGDVSVSRIDPRRARIAVAGTADSSQVITVRTHVRGCDWTFVDRTRFASGVGRTVMALPRSIGALSLKGDTLFTLDQTNAHSVDSWTVVRLHPTAVKP